MAGAQDEPGFQLIVGLESTLRADDNYAMDTASAGNSFVFENDVSVRVLSETRTALLDASVGGLFQAAEIAGTGSSSARTDMRRPSERSCRRRS